MKLLRLLAWITGGLLLAFICIGILFPKLYENEVKKQIVTQLNKFLDSEIKVAEIELSLFNKFPYASLNFEEVLIKDSYKNIPSEKKDTFLYAKNLYLKFNILDIIKKKYAVKQVEIDNGVVKLELNKDGTDNYHFWKTAKNKKPSPFLLKLDDIYLKNSRLSFNNKINNQYFLLKEGFFELSGKFSNETFHLQGITDCHVQKVLIDNISYASNRYVQLEMALDVNTKLGTYIIKEGNLEVEDCFFDVTGSVEKNNLVNKCDINIIGKDLNLQTLKSLLPQKARNSLVDYDGNGLLTFNCSVKGNINAREVPVVKAGFSLNNANITERKSGVMLNNLSMNGIYLSNKVKNIEKLAINSLRANFGSGGIEAIGEIQHFENPRVTLNAKGKFSLIELFKFFKADDIKNPSGQAIVELNFKGQAPPKQQFNKDFFDKATATGQIKLENAGFEIISSKTSLQQINGNLHFRNNLLRAKKISVMSQGSDLMLDGYLNNWLTYLFFDDELLDVDLKTQSNKLDLGTLLSTAPQENTPPATDTNKNNLLSRIEFKISSRVDSFKYRKFEATRVKTNLEYIRGFLDVKSISFKNSDGYVELKGKLEELNNNKYELICAAELKGLKIDKAFYQLDNFGQKVIVDNQVKGKFYGKIDFYTELNNDFTIDEEKIYSKAKIKISNGEIIELEALKAISNYMQNNKMVAPFLRVDKFEKTMKHVYFSQLTNTIEIKKGKVIIPKMDIRSNAMNLKFQGTHSFDNNIDYKFNFKLSEILKQKPKSSEFGEIEDDGLGSSLYLTMRGTEGDYRIKYDRKAVRSKIKNDLRKEKNTFKALLKDEFGTFNNQADSLKVDKKKETKVELEFEEEQNSTDVTPSNDTIQTESGSKVKKSITKFFEKITEEDTHEEAKPKIELEEDDDF